MTDRPELDLNDGVQDRELWSKEALAHLDDALQAFEEYVNGPVAQLLVRQAGASDCMVKLVVAGEREPEVFAITRERRL